MKFRVKEGAAYLDKAGGHHEAGAVVEVDEHEAAIVPWCLESAPQNDPEPVVEPEPAKPQPPPAPPKGKKSRA